MRVAIIGAGAAGLAALRHCVNYEDVTVVCYEKTDKIGGTWVYVPETGIDRYGLPIHSSMYKNLRTNLPKEVMGFPDYPIPESEESYLTREQILGFLNSYCDHFNLRNRIVFLHNVLSVEPISTNNEDNNNGDKSNEHERKWKLKIKSLDRNADIEEIFDYVMVCNGHYFEGNIALLKGREIFKGKQMHSHDYRVPDIFSNQKVVVLGAGPSGMDLALDISKTANKVILSHHLKDPICTVFPDNVVQKPDIEELTENGAIFKDGSEEQIDVVFYCTGYKYNFLFLEKSCGVNVDSNMVTPLWKHLVATENPSLALVGLPFYVCAFSMFDLQVRFLMKFWRGEKQFPPKEKMLEEEQQELRQKLASGLSKRNFHMMGPAQGDYYKDLAETAGVKPLPPVLTKLHNDSSMRFLDDLVHYRKDRYRILDDENFVKLDSLNA